MEYAARLVRLIDGDTAVFAVSATSRFLDQVHLHTHPALHVRLLGTWCPERHKPGGAEATAFAEDWLALHDHGAGAGPPLVVESADTYTLGRLLGIVRCATDRACLNEDLIEAGHATPEKSKAHVEALRALARERGPASPAGRLLRKATEAPD